MAKLECNCCNNVFFEEEIVESGSMKRCPKCGSLDFESFVKTRIVLNFSGHKISIHKDSQVGRDNFRIIKDYKYVSQFQFKIIKKEDGWFIKGNREVVNPTFLDGHDVADREALIKENSEILIGNKTLNRGLKIRVSFDK